MLAAACSALGPKAYVPHPAVDREPGACRGPRHRGCQIGNRVRYLGHRHQRPVGLPGVQRGTLCFRVLRTVQKSADPRGARGTRGHRVDTDVAARQVGRHCQGERQDSTLAGRVIGTLWEAARVRW